MSQKHRKIVTAVLAVLLALLLILPIIASAITGI